MRPLPEIVTRQIFANYFSSPKNEKIFEFSPVRPGQSGHNTEMAVLTEYLQGVVSL